MRTYKTTGYKKRHYEDLARILGACESVAGIRAQITNLFERDNPRFDRGRFDARIQEYETGKRVANG